jgi:hypothetical protein
VGAHAEIAEAQGDIGDWLVRRCLAIDLHIFLEGQVSRGGGGGARKGMGGDWVRFGCVLTAIASTKLSTKLEGEFRLFLLAS